MNTKLIISLAAGSLFLAAAGPAFADDQPERAISKVEAVSVDAPVGTAPVLPYRVWVTYTDGTSDWRQVRWSNSALADEQAEADPAKNPVGTTYTVAGHVTGDFTTDEGYPVSASVKVVSGTYKIPAQTPKAHVFPLYDVSVDGNNRLTNNRDLDIENLLSLDVSQQLYNYRDTYGLSTDGYTVSDGWDSPDTKLKGHGVGHYLSAMAFAYASAKDPAKKAQIKSTLRRIVDEMRECQERTFVWSDSLGRYFEARDLPTGDKLLELKGTWAAFDEYKKDYQHYGYGYINAIPPQHVILGEAYRAYNNSDWIWAPYYTVHKQLAGLIDIALNVDDKEIADKAALIAKDMGLWIWNRIHYCTYVDDSGTQATRRARPGNRYEMWNIYIAGELGGVQESLARLASMTDNKDEKAKLLEAAEGFDNVIFYNNLEKNIDDIRTRHANQHIPQIIGAIWSYSQTGDARYYNIARNFWNLIQGRYRYSPGGVGNGEMFRQPYTQILSMVGNGDPTLNETCCAYNLAKLTKDLALYDPDNAAYMDYYERVLYNQIVGSVNADQYGVCYQYAVGLNADKPFGNETPQSTCCGGTGAENHVKYQEATYFADDNTLWVGLYMPTTLNWKEKGVTISQDCLWPAEKSTIKVSGNGTFAMKLRVPYWATKGFDIQLNGKSVAASYQPSSYVEIPSRAWKSGDEVTVIMPFTKHLDFGPDKLEGKDWVATLMYGPLAMTGTGVTTWDEATLQLDPYLTTVVANGASDATGSYGNLYTLTAAGKTFVPDYFAKQHITHYYKIELLADPSEALKAIVRSKVEDTKAYQAANYTKKSYKPVTKAIADAGKAVAAAKLTQAETDKLTGALDAAVAGLVESRKDVSRLETALASAKALSANDYTWDSFETLQKEIAAGDALDNASSAQKAVDAQVKKVDDAAKALVSLSDIDRTKLVAAIRLANEREAAQEEWMNMEKKVPDFAPWAPNGYRDMLRTLNKARNIRDNVRKNFNQSEVSEIATELNSVINSMRPGNLAEPQQLEPLFDLIYTYGKKDTPEMHSAMEYANMVVRYVFDGSGTPDMIQKAIDGINAAK